MADTTELLSLLLSRRPLAHAARAALCGLAVAATCVPANVTAQAGSAGSALPARPQRSVVGCLIAPDRVADVGSPVIGIVSKMKVDIGDSVRAGQTLATLRADVESAGVDAASARAAIDADVRAAEASLVLARQRHQRARELQAQGFVSPQATEQALAEQEVAVQKLRQAQGQKRVSAGDLGVVRAQLGLRKLKSSFDGVVVERYVHPGERVDDKPLLRVAVLDPLRVELVVPAARYGSVALKDRIDVLPELPGMAAVQARVTHIDPIIDAASNTFRVRLKLPNPGNRLPGGARCRVDLPAPPGAASTPPGAAPVVLPVRADMPRKVAG